MSTGYFTVPTILRFGCVLKPICVSPIWTKTRVPVSAVAPYFAAEKRDLPAPACRLTRQSDGAFERKVFQLVVLRLIKRELQ
jgi:hypothetical protein